MAFTIINPISGVTPIAVIETGVTLGSSATAVPTPPLYPGMIVQAQDPLYGMGEFILLLGVASLAAGDWVTYQAGSFTPQRWVGTGIDGRALAVAMSANTSATNWSWYQISGAAVCNISGAVVAGDKVYFQATAVTSSTPVASKQVMGAVAGGASGTPAAGKAVVNIQRPHTQGAIT